MRINPTNKFFWEKCNTTLRTQIVEVNSKKVSWTSKNLSSNPCSISNGLCHIYTPYIYAIRESSQAGQRIFTLHFYSKNLFFFVILGRIYILLIFVLSWKRKKKIKKTEFFWLIEKKTNGKWENVMNVGKFIVLIFFPCGSVALLNF
jgi:hypothetical protein